VRFLARVEFGLAAAQPALGLRHAHALLRRSRMRSDSNSATIARTLNSQSPDGIGRVVHRAADAELDLAIGQVLEDVARVRQ
jgi:hypothetical protein